MSILVNPYKHSTTPDLDKLYVVTTVFNPMRYKSRYELYDKFAEGMGRLGANLVTVELALGDRPFELTRHDEVRHVQLRTKDEFWLKESALNVGISRLPNDWKYVMWVDADVEFHRQDILEEVVHQLQHAAVVQCFEDAVDLGPRGEVIETHKGFVWSWWNQAEALSLVGGTWKELTPTYYGASTTKATSKSRTSILHPGFAWAARREALADLGGLLDVGILGASDHHMAHALVGRVLEASPPNLTDGYKHILREWQRRADTHIRQNIGYVPGMLFHHFHGPKRKRYYNERWEILHKHKFDPSRDLKRDWSGLYTFTDDGLRMRGDIRRYLIDRCEDSAEI